MQTPSSLAYTVSPQLLARDDFRAACRERDFGEGFRLMRKYDGVSQDKMSSPIEGLGQSRISRIMRNKERISDAVRIPGSYPWWTSNDIANELSDRSTDPFLRTYLWSYPAGIDWFATLADTADNETIKRVLHGTFQRPLSPTDLAALWPAGPTTGSSPADQAAVVRR